MIFEISDFFEALDVIRPSIADTTHVTILQQVAVGCKLGRVGEKRNPGGQELGSLVPSPVGLLKNYQKHTKNRIFYKDIDTLII